MARTRSAPAGFATSALLQQAGEQAERLARHLFTAPSLRRLILILISVFLLLTIVGTVSHVIFGKRVALQEARQHLGLIADATAAALQLRGSGDSDNWQGDLAASLPAGATLDGRMVLLAGADGRIKATAPYDLERQNRTIDQVIGSSQPLIGFGAPAGALPITLDDGVQAIATIRNLHKPDAQLAIIQLHDQALRGWWNEAAFDITIFSTTGLLLVLFGAAFLWLPHANSAAASASAFPLSAKLDQTLQEAGCGLWDWNIARGHVSWSNSMFGLLGRDPSDQPLAFREIAKAVHGEDDLYARVEHAMRQQEGTIDQTFRIKHTDGNWIWVKLSGRLERDRGTGESHLVAIVRPVQDPSAAGTWTAGADARLRDAIESISEAFVLWDSDNRLVLCNSKYQQFHKLADDIVVPGTPYEKVAVSATQPIVRSQNPVSKSENSDARTYEAQLDDNRWLHVDERRTNDGGYVSVSTDITGLKQNEQKLFESEKELMATVADLQLSRRELEQQKQQLVDLTEKYALEKNRAEAANKSKSEFLANFSHELRTPLNAVIGFSDVMQNGLFGPLGSEKYDEYARDIHESGNFLLQVINDILDMAKIEAGRITLNVEELDLGEIVGDSIRVVAQGAKERNVTLKRTGVRKLKMQADRRALKQILLNLLSNAVKFTPADGTVSVRLSRSTKGRVRIAIADTGIGIPERELDKLGRPFEQVENQFTKSHKGSGLGLAISRSLVEMHGGHIEIASEEGKGTTVSVVLPLRPVLMGTDLGESEGASAA